MEGIPAFGWQREQFERAIEQLDGIDSIRLTPEELKIRARVLFLALMRHRGFTELEAYQIIVRYYFGGKATEEARRLCIEKNARVSKAFNDKADARFLAWPRGELIQLIEDATSPTH